MIIIPSRRLILFPEKLVVVSLSSWSLEVVLIISHASFKLVLTMLFKSSLLIPDKSISGGGPAGLMSFKNILAMTLDDPAI